LGPDIQGFGDGVGLKCLVEDPGMVQRLKTAERRTSAVEPELAVGRQSEMPGPATGDDAQFPPLVINPLDGAHDPLKSGVRTYGLDGRHDGPDVQRFRRTHGFLSFSAGVAGHRCISQNRKLLWNPRAISKSAERLLADFTRHSSPVPGAASPTGACGPPVDLPAPME